MKPAEIKNEYIRLRASGKSYSFIADRLHISKSTCSKWETQLGADIAQLKREELNTLYEAYHMTKKARIKKLGETLEKVEDALKVADLTEVAPEKLLDYKLKYTEALQKEYVSTDPSIIIKGNTNGLDIINALGDLLDRARAGDITTEQASRESIVLTNLLKAYETVEIKAKLDKIEALMGSR